MEVGPAASDSSRTRPLVAFAGDRCMLFVVKIAIPLLLAGLATLGFAAEPAAPAVTPKAYSLNDCVSTLDLSRATKTPTGCQFWFVGRDLANGKTLKMSVVQPHSAIHGPHRHAEDEFYYILAGQAEVFLNGATKVIGPDSSFYCPSENEHGIRNVGDTELRYLVIKLYNPDNPNAAPTRS